LAAYERTTWKPSLSVTSHRVGLAQLEAELPEQAYAAALKRGRGLELDEIVNELIGPKS
jgi:hypothetical protein